MGNKSKGCNGCKSTITVERVIGQTAKRRGTIEEIVIGLEDPRLVMQHNNVGNIVQSKSETNGQGQTSHRFQSALDNQ